MLQSYPFQLFSIKLGVKEKKDNTILSQGCINTITFLIRFIEKQKYFEH